MDLFGTGPQQLFEDAEGGIEYRPGFVDGETAARWFDSLRAQVPWQAQRRPRRRRARPGTSSWPQGACC
jgi:hypothetical protein